jgi:hypothetical protein
MWNQYYPNKKIKSSNYYVIWNDLKENMKNTCNKESCWLKQRFIEEKGASKKLLESFLPETPESWKKNPNEWLSNIDINNVLKNYEKAHKDFEFLGPSPIDFKYKYNTNNCVCNKLCNFNIIEKIKKKINKIGIIFNLDPHYKGGSHWVSLFVDIKKEKIYYFDSVGEKIKNEIMELVHTIIEQGNRLEKPIHFKFEENYPNEHQYKGSECGVYSLYFIISMLENKKSFRFFKEKKIKDDQIHKYRRVFFNWEL